MSPQAPSTDAPPRAPAPIGILSALLDEQRGLLAHLQDAHKTRHASRTFWSGRLAGQPVVLALTRVGKVAAAHTTATLIERFGVRRVLFTGVAGGLADAVAVGDVVVATGFVQHDMDARPLFARYELPLYGCTTLACDPALTAMLYEALYALSTSDSDRFGLHAPAAVHRGLVASGDQFVGDAAQAQAILAGLAQTHLHPLAVEMEGAAVAQVCHDHGVPLAAMRSISDRADASAHVDFSRFVAERAGPLACAVVRAWLQGLPD